MMYKFCIIFLCQRSVCKVFNQRYKFFAIQNPHSFQALPDSLYPIDTVCYVKQELLSKNKKAENQSYGFQLIILLVKMQVAGLEPARCHHRQILSLLRLPFRHTCVATQCLYILTLNCEIVNIFLTELKNYSVLLYLNCITLFSSSSISPFLFFFVVRIKSEK